MPSRGVGPARGLDRCVTGAQLLLLAGGEQQRVVDAGPEAEHAGQRRREPERRSRRLPTSGRRSRPDAGERRAQRVASGAQVAQDGDQQDDRDRQPISSPTGNPPVAAPSTTSPDMATSMERGSPDVAASSPSRAASSSWSAGLS